MNALTRDELKQLATWQSAPCLSLYMPSHRVGEETRQDPIRFRNLLRQAEELLAADGLRTPEVRAMLEPAQKLVDDSAFWRQQGDGLAVMVAPGFTSTYHLPYTVPETVVSGERFQIKPLLPLFAGDGRFFVLALSQNAVRLFEGTRFMMHEMPAGNLPKNLESALAFDELEPQLQSHSVPSQGRGDGSMIFHGHGADADVAKDRLLRFCRAVDAALHPILHQEHAPLICAAVDYLVPIYREANTYPRLMQEAILGNPDNASADSLHAAAWDAVQPYFWQDRHEALALFRQLAGSGHTSTAVDEVALAAHQGRVATLFVPMDQQVWGRFEPETARAEMHIAHEPRDEDLLNVAAVYTILNGGNLYVVDPADMPDSEPIAALLRY